MQDIKNKRSPTQTNQSSDKLLTILEVLAAQDDPVRLQDLAKQAGMNPSTVLRFLTALQHRDYVAQDIDTDRYYLTLKLCGLAHNISSRFNVRNISLPFLRGLTRAFLESANLTIESDLSVMYVEVLQGPQKTLMTMQHIGNIAPMHCTGVGKLLLSNRSYAELQQFVALKGLPRLTASTITETEALWAELEQIRRQGYSFDNEECEMGARCIAAPIRDFTGAIVAGISVSGPAARMTDSHIYANLPVLLESAEQISIRLGWQAGAIE